MTVSDHVQQLQTLLSILGPCRYKTVHDLPDTCSAHGHHGTPLHCPVDKVRHDLGWTELPAETASPQRSVAHAADTPAGREPLRLDELWRLIDRDDQDVLKPIVLDAVRRRVTSQTARSVIETLIRSYWA